MEVDEFAFTSGVGKSRNVKLMLFGYNELNDPR